MSIATAARLPLTFAALPLASWMFAIRIWIAVLMALYAGFWLQLESPSSAAITVAILALPTRGQALEKAGFRLAGTVIGVAAAIAITGLFSQATELLLFAFAAWMGLCVYGTGLLDGNRAYAAVLSGYTVALIAILHIDAPQQVFDSGVARGAAITVGIAAIALVNDLLVAPDRHGGLMAQLAALHRRVRDTVKAIASGKPVDGTATTALMDEIAMLRSDITSLVAETTSSAGTAAARSALAAMVALLHAARSLSVLPLAAAPRLRDRLMAALDEDVDGNPHEVGPQPRFHGAAGQGGEPALAAAALDWAVTKVLRRDHHVREALAALANRRRPPHAWRAPLYRSQRIALASGLRAAVWVALAAAFFTVAGWPASDEALALVVVVIGLGSLNADPRSATMGALIAMPIAIVLAGIVEFLMLDGVNAFPLLAIALAPVVIGPALMMTLSSPRLVGLGRLILIFTLAILQPSNPPSYDPQAYLFFSMFTLVAVGLLLAAQYLVPPVSAAQRCRWMIRAARAELAHLCATKAGRRVAEEAMFRDALRIVQLGQAAAGAAIYRPVQEEALDLFGQAGFVRLADAALAKVMDRGLMTAVAGARRALATRDPRAIDAAALVLHDAAAAGAAAATEAAAALFVVGRVLAQGSAIRRPVERTP